jgi:3-oxoacyl-(acyl-carrier-protein) synthase
MSGVREIVEAARTLYESGLRRLSPYFVPKVLANSAAGRLSLQHQLRGPNHSASTACAAGAHAIGDAMRCIQYDNADIMLAGGTEACIDPLFAWLDFVDCGLSPPVLSHMKLQGRLIDYAMGLSWEKARLF